MKRSQKIAVRYVAFLKVHCILAEFAALRLLERKELTHSQRS